MSRVLGLRSLPSVPCLGVWRITNHTNPSGEQWQALLKLPTQHASQLLEQVRRRSWMEIKGALAWPGRVATLQLVHHVMHQTLGVPWFL